MKDSKIVSRLKKLIARAKDQEGTPEGELAASIAARLMRDHAIEMSQINIEHEEEILHLSGDVKVSQVWWSMLYHSIGKYCDVEIAYAAERGGRWITFVGYRHNVEICKFLYDSISHQIEKEWKQHRKSEKERCKKEGINYEWNKPNRKNFFASAVRAVRLRLRRMKREQESEAKLDKEMAKANEIILVRKNKVAEYTAGLGWRAGTSYRSGHSSAGASAGNNVRIQKGLNGQRKLNG